MTNFVTFEDIEAPLLIGERADLVDLVRRVMPKWPFTVKTSSETPPFFSIEVTESGRDLCKNLITQGKPRQLDALNAVCDVVAAMPLALVACQPAYLCLHAAAIEIAGRLVVIPNARRAGKSTLAAVFAQGGNPIYTDDFLPVCFDRLGQLVGRAGGISPRMRLPVPKSLGADFRAWVSASPGPDNGQYKYLDLADLPPSGCRAPLGAIVFIEREAGHPPTLSPLDPARAMDALLYQNFTREVHSGDVLKTLARMIGTLPSLRLTYGEASEAVALLERSFRTWPDPVPTDGALAGALARADLDVDRAITVSTSGRYRQKPGAAMAEIGDALYLSDRDGQGIHRLNPVSQAIWVLLERPVTLPQIGSMLSEAFPDTNPATIGSDVTQFVTRLGALGLIIVA